MTDSLQDVLNIIEQDTALVIRLSGRLDSTQSAAIAAPLAERIRQSSKPVIFDMEEVSFVSSAFLRVCILTAKSMEAGSLQVVNTSPMIKKVFKLAGLDGSLLKVSATHWADVAAPHEALYAVAPDRAADALLGPGDYETRYRRSLSDPAGFWSDMAHEFLEWSRPWEETCQWDFGTARIQWFQGGQINVSVNCLDRHLEQYGDRTAILWEGDEPGTQRELSYRQLHEQVCRFANALKSQGVAKGDRVAIYMPMIPEAAVAMLACTRIGAVHSVVFGGFSAEALKDRILDCDCRVVICADEGRRGGKIVPLKQNVDEAVNQCPDVRSVVVVRHTGRPIDWQPDRDRWYGDLLAVASPDCHAVPMEAEDPLFILYTSGSTGKPKGILHTTGGYLLHAAATHRYVFDYHDGDIYWCTADLGWITGHSYVVYGPLCNGATTLMFEGVPSYPEPDRFWRIVEKYRVSLFYTAPTAIRTLMGLGNRWVHGARMGSLRLLGSVGEPINPEAWEWYYHVVGDSRCPIMDTWWQTETGGIMITPLPGVTGLKPGSATLPFFGVEPVVLDPAGEPLAGPAEGVLALARSWPGQARTIWGDHQRFYETYFAPYPGYFFTGDGARRDSDGYYWITGRVDDVINIAGHRLGTAEIESALVLHPQVAEAAVVGHPHPVKGQGIYAFVTLNSDAQPSVEIEKALILLVRKEIGPIATPDVIQWAPALPKTRSGKIMRRILRKIAANELDQLGDVSTLADSAVVNQLVEGRPIPDGGTRQAG